MVVIAALEALRHSKTIFSASGEALLSHRSRYGLDLCDGSIVF
jgi:hypothetical protein